MKAQQIRAEAKAAGMTVACYAPAIGHENCNREAVDGWCKCECHAGKPLPKWDKGPRFMGSVLR